MQDVKKTKPRRKPNRVRNCNISLRGTAQEKARIEKVETELGLCRMEMIMYLIDMYEGGTNHGSSKE